MRNSVSDGGTGLDISWPPLSGRELRTGRVLRTGSKYIEDGLVLSSPSEPKLAVGSDFLSGSGSLRRFRISEISGSEGGVLWVVASN